LSKEFARVLGPGQIVTSLENLGTVPGVQVTYRRLQITPLVSVKSFSYKPFVYLRLLTTPLVSLKSMSYQPLRILIIRLVSVKSLSYKSFEEFARVLGPGQIVTSLENLGTVPGVQVTYR
jgi:hypothetical protein